MNIENHSTIYRLSLMVSSHVVGTVNIVTVLAIAPLITDELSLSATQLWGWAFTHCLPYTYGAIGYIVGHCAIV